MADLPEKVLVLGSGGLRIGQAGEFDYSGSQALKALREAGVKTVLVNPNIATNQTSEGMADTLYLQPVDFDTVKRIIENERPDGILLGFGGQTGLNVGVELAKRGVLKEFNVQVLGTPVSAIEDTEDRDRFKARLDEIEVHTAVSRACATVGEAEDAARDIGFPIMIRSAYSLGGLGSGIARNAEELVTRAVDAFALASQVLVEEYLEGWKEVEYEVVRDRFDSCVTVCNMENMDPMGIHTGESIVIAPSQTLDNREYHMLREIALRVVRHLGIVGECNIQYALDPKSCRYRVIEVNARLSRSSALASKATGYPLAAVAAELSLGRSLADVSNAVTGTTRALFEPALDYVVVKAPRWDLDRFRGVDPQIGSQMKSVGEVMAIGRCFEEALQKALRMIGTGMHGVVGNTLQFDDLAQELEFPTQRRVFAVGAALTAGMKIEKIAALTRIDHWFLAGLARIVEGNQQLQAQPFAELPTDLLRRLKVLGFSDYQIAKATGVDMGEVRARRRRDGVLPVIKQIDTLAAEYPARTNYLYMTYSGDEHDVEPKPGAVMVLGGGPYRIGSSVEFDWCCVNAVKTAREAGYPALMINCNPETVSTDYDICDRLYFEELTFERVLDIYEFEYPEGLIVSMGGQVANTLAPRLHEAKVNILGTSPVDIDRAEDRNKFSALLDRIGVDQPDWIEATSLQEAQSFAERVGYPVMIRPSYVLSGSAMAVVFDRETMASYLTRATEVKQDSPVVLSKFVEAAKEVEFDGVARDGEVLIYAMGEHVENAGVHSGDATVVIPPQRLYVETARRIKRISRRIARELRITGPFNVQYLAKENRISVIECNLRASRTFPFASKVMDRNFIEIATRAILGEETGRVDSSSLDLDRVGVKAAQFSFQRLKGADPTMGVAMASTGEVGCIGADMDEALLLALRSVGFRLGKKTALISAGPPDKKSAWVPVMAELRQMGYHLYATAGTARFMRQHGFKVDTLRWPLEKREPNCLTAIRNGDLGLVINLPKNNEEQELSNDYQIRRTAIDNNVPLLTNLSLTKRLLESLQVRDFNNLPLHQADYSED